MSGKGQIIVLQVYLEPTEATKTMKFPADIPIHSIIADIQKIQGLGVGGRDHGLFRAPVKGSMTQAAVNGAWMERSRTLKYYNIKNNQLIEYKKKHRPMEVKLIDDSIKSFIVDDSQSVRKISDKLGEHLELGKDAEQFCLCWPGSTIKRPLWLEENLTLHEQPDPSAPKAKAIDEKTLNKNVSKKNNDNVIAKIKAAVVDTPKGPLLLWKRYYAHDSDISKLSNSFLLNIYFIGTMKQILCGMFPLGRTDAKNFAALLLQATKGDYIDPQKNKDGGLILIPSTEILPPMYHNDKKLPIDIYAEWKRLVGAKEDIAKNRFIQLARSMKTYGMTFYDFTETKLDEVASKKSKKQKFSVTSICLGVASTKLAYYAPETNQFTKFIPYTSLRRYEILTTTLTLMLAQQEGDDGPEVIQLESPDADEVYGLIEGYIAIILRERQDTQKVITDESGSVAEMEDDEAKWFQADVGTQGRGFQNPNAIYNYGMPGSMMRQADPEESRMVNHVTNLDDAIRGMKGISDHIASGKGAWGQRKTENEWKKDLTNANVFIAPALADFLEECRLNEKGNRRMLDVLSKSVYAQALNMTQAGQQLAALNDDCAALLDGAKAVADSLADIMSLCSDDKNPPSEALLDACLKQHNIMMHLIKDPELLHHIDSGSEYLLMNCLYDIDNQASKLISTALQSTEKLAIAKQANQIKGLALSALAALIPYASSPTILSQIAVAEDMLLQSLIPLDMDLTQIKEAIALLGIGKNICENSMIDGNIDITSPAADLLSSLALIRAEMATGNTAQLYGQVGKVQAAHQALKENMIKLIPNTEDKLSIRLTKAEYVIGQEINNFNQASNILMTENLGSSFEAQETMKKNLLERIGKLEEQSQLLIVDVGVLTTLNNLRHHSKQVAADLIRLKTATVVAAEHVPDKNAKELHAASKDISTSLNYLFADLRNARDNPNNLLIQTKLMQSIQKEMPEWEHLIKTSTGVIPLLNYDGDDSLKKAQVEAINNRMTEGTLDAKNSTHLLKRAVKRMGELEGNMLISQALMELEMIKATVENAEVMASQGQLPFDHRLDALASAIKVQKASDKFLQLSKQLVVASTEDDAFETMPELIMANVNSLERLIATQHNLAGITSDKRLQTNILRVAHQTVEDSINLIAVSRVIIDVDCTQEQRDLAKEAQAKIMDHLVNLQSGYGEADYEEIKSLKDDVERKKFKIAMGPLQSATKTQPIIEEQTLLLERAFTLSLNQLVDAVLYNPKNTRFPLSVFVGVAVDLLDQFTFHPKLTGKVKMEIGEFHENLVKVIDAIQLLGKSRNQDNIDAMLKAAQIPPQTLRGIVEALLGETKSEVNQSVLDLMSVLDMIESNKITAFPTIKEEVLAEMSTNLGALNRSLAPITVSNDLATSNPSLLTTVAMESSKIAAQMATTANASKRPVGQKQPCSLAATRVLQTCDIANNNNTNKPVLQNVGKTTPAMLNKLIVTTRAAMEKESEPKKRDAQLKALEEVVAAAKPFIKECNTPNNNLKIVGTSIALKDKVLALQESLYPVPKDSSELSAFAFTPVESQKLCNVSKAVAISAANLIQNSLLKPADCESNVVHDEKQKKAQAEFESNMRILSKLITDKEETKELVLKTIDLVRLASFQLISAETAVTFGQSLSLPDDFDKEKSTHANDAYNSTLQCIVNVKNILDAYKTNDPQKLAAVIRNIKNTMNSFANQIVTTAAMMNDFEKQKEILTPSATFAIGLLPLLKAIETHDVSDTDSFPAIVQSALPVINTLKVLNEKLTNQRSNQDKIDGIMQSVNEALSSPASNPSSNYEQNRAQLIQGVHKVGLDLAQLVNSQASAELILKHLEVLADTTKEFLGQAKNTVASCPDKSVAHTLNELSDNVGKSVLKAISFSKDEVIGINLHSQQLGNFHSSIAEIDKVVNLLTSVEKVLLEGTSAEILDSIAALTKLKLMVQNDEISRVPDYKEKSALTLASKLPLVNGACQKLSAVNNNLGTVSDLEIGTQANSLAASTKAFDEAIYDIVFTLKNKKDQEDLLDRAIDVTILASSSLNPKLGSAGRADTTKEANQKLTACQQKLNDIQNIENDEQKRLEARFQNTIDKMHVQFQPNALASVPKKENSTPLVLIQDCQNILAVVSQSMNTSSFADSVVATEALPALVQNLLSTEYSFPDLDPSLKDDFTAASKDLADNLGDFMKSQTNARDQSGNLSEAALKPNVQKVIEATSKIQDLTRRLPSNLVAEIVDDSSKDIEQSTEDELMKCAKMIQDAVKLLSSVQTGAKVKSSVGISTQDVSEAILEAARSIGMGVGDLVTAAALVQSERKVAAQTSSNKYNADPAWANGLVSAAQLVTENVRQLVTAANNTAKGGEGSEEEKLVALSKAVAAVTVSLLTASRSKAEDPTANSQRQLTKAAVAVQLSTGQLVVAAQAAQELKDTGVEEDDFSKMDFKAASGLRAQMEQMGKIEKLEKELRDCHQDLIKLRRARYQDKKSY